MGVGAVPVPLVQLISFAPSGFQLGALFSVQLHQQILSAFLLGNPKSMKRHTMFSLLPCIQADRNSSYTRSH